MVAADASVATDRDLERGRAPAQRLLRQTPNQRVARRPPAAATATPLIGLHHAAREHGALWLKALADGHKPELIEPAEHGQVRAREARPRGSVRHVEVFRMGSVRTSILGRPRPLPGPRRAEHRARIDVTPRTPSTVKSPFVTNDPPIPCTRPFLRSDP